MRPRLQGGTFGIFPAKLCSGLTPFEQTVLSWIWFHTNNDTGKCFPSIATLCRESGTGRTKTKECLKLLEEKGLISTDTRFIDGRQTSNSYTVWMFPKDAASRPEGSTSRPEEGSQEDLTGGRSTTTEPEEERPEEEEHTSATAVHAPSASDYAPLEAVWTERCGVVQFGRFRKALRPVVEALGGEGAAAALSSYLDKTDPKYVSEAGFARVYKRFVAGSEASRPMGAY
jgi:hypothetical protein